MKKILLFLLLIAGFAVSCNTSKPAVASDNSDKPVLAANDTVRISDQDNEFDIIILDPQFNSWFNTYARPRASYTQHYLEQRNRVWVTEWNIRATNPMRYGSMYDFPINYNSSTDYGFEVNYMLFNYLTYFQLKYRQRLGGFAARI
ncbi:MAG TPA: DUF6146 family protein [Flavobacterium sp.]|jgi:hypothetical protein